MRPDMPLTKIHIVEERYDQARIVKLSAAVQGVLRAHFAFRRNTFTN
jgi:hypothetical protein